MDRISLLIASEDYSLSRGLTVIFSTETMFKVIGCYKLEEVVAKCIELQPDAILIDMCSQVSKLGVPISKIKKECPCSMIFLLIENEKTESLQGLIQGIDGIIPKGIMRGCLLKTLELACQSGIFCLPGSIKKIFSFGERINEITGQITINKDINVGFENEALTKREMEVLQLLAGNLSNREIATKLYISEPTVKTHVSNILRKLGQSSRSQAIVYSYKKGLVKIH